MCVSSSFMHCNRRTSVPHIVFLAYCHDGSVPSQIKLEEDLYILNVDYQAMQKNMSTPNFVPALQFAPSDALSCFSAAIHEARTMLQFFNEHTCHFHTRAAHFLFLNEIMKYACFFVTLNNMSPFTNEN